MDFPCKNCGAVIELDDSLLDPGDDWIKVGCTGCGVVSDYSVVRIEEYWKQV